MITRHPSVIINSIKVSDLDEIRNVCFQEEHLRDIEKFFFGLTLLDVKFD